MGAAGRLLPPVPAGEAAFAVSGTCVETLGTEHAWIATGVRHLHTVAFRDTQHGILAGGDLDAPDALSRNVAISSNGGKTWRLVDGTPFPGAAFGLSYVGRRAESSAGRYEEGRILKISF